MKEENNDLPLYDGEDNDESNEQEFEFEMESLPDCPITDILMSSIIGSKPFGMTWSTENMKSFLKEKGYKIITRYSSLRDSEYEVAIKPGSTYIPDEDFSNIKDEFESEVQIALLKWLSKQ